MIEGNGVCVRGARANLSARENWLRGESRGNILVFINLAFGRRDFLRSGSLRGCGSVRTDLRGFSTLVCAYISVDAFLVQRGEPRETWIPRPGKSNIVHDRHLRPSGNGQILSPVRSICGRRVRCGISSGRLVKIEWGRSPISGIRMGETFEKSWNCETGIINARFND